MTTKVHPSARHEYMEFLYQRDEEVHEEATEADEMAKLAEATHEHDFLRDRDDWARYCGAEAWQRGFNADQWLELMTSKFLFDREELAEEYRQRQQDDEDGYGWPDHPLLWRHDMIH